jgi:glycosyltransferase involved in cell wall biosynthesis
MEFRQEFSEVNMPLVSIVTPAYNAAKYINQTIESINQQDYPNIEHIIIDDGSTDSTQAILITREKEYNLRWFSQDNEGQAAAMNKGFEEAKGSIVIWLNADDVFFSRSAISDIVRTFKEKDADVVYGHMAIIDSQNRLHKLLFAPPKINIRILSFGHFAACISFRRNIALRYKLSSQLHYALDYDQCLRMAQNNCRFANVGKTLLAWRMHGGAKSMKRKDLLLYETKRLVKKYRHPRGIRSKIAKFIVLSYILIRKFFGIIDVVTFYMLSKQKQLPFIGPEQSLVSLMIRQLLPFI